MVEHRSTTNEMPSLRIMPKKDFVLDNHANVIS